MTPPTGGSIRRKAIGASVFRPPSPEIRMEGAVPGGATAMLKPGYPALSKGVFRTPKRECVISVYAFRQRARGCRDSAPPSSLRHGPAHSRQAARCAGAPGGVVSTAALNGVPPGLDGSVVHSAAQALRRAGLRSLQRAAGSASCLAEFPALGSDGAVASVLVLV